jgi:hydrogenase expression/formation protein HypC
MCLGIPGRIVDRRIEQGLPMGTVDFGGVRRDVCLAYVADEVRPGDWVVVHVGFAIARVDEEAAERTLALLQGGPADRRTDGPTGPTGPT